MNSRTTSPGRQLFAEIRRAVDSRNFEAYANLYADDAELEEVSSLNPPAHPHVTRGRDAILERLRGELLHDPVAGWTRAVKSSEIVDGLETDDALAFTEVRTYEAGDKVVAQHIAHKRGGLIQRDRMVIAWDGTT